MELSIFSLIQYNPLMNNWLLYSLLATLFYGVLNFLYKMAAERKYVNQAVILISASSVIVSAFITILISGTGVSLILPALPYALANGSLFAIGAISKFQALKLAPASGVFPVNKSNVLFVILIGIIAFDEAPSMQQWLGISTSILVLILISSEQINRSGKVSMKGIYFAFFAALCTSFSMTVGKMASVSVDRTTYILLSYTMVALISFLFYIKRTPSDKRKETFNKPGIFVIGIAIGVLNYFGYKLVLQAFASGSMSLVQPILALSILIPIFLSAFIYKEKLTVLRVISIGLTLASIMLIKSS